MNKAIIVVLAICIGVALAEVPCWGEDCTFDAKGDPNQKADIVEAVKVVDTEMRRVYWYYLRGSRRLFQANIDTPTRFVHFFIFRNIVGTFLGIGSWDHATQVAEVNTFVRLGNGYEEGVTTNYQPVDINPFVISLRLKHGEFLIEIDENGEIQCVEGGYCPEPPVVNENGALTITDEKCAKLDDFIRENYWHYLTGAAIIHFESIPTTQRVYAVFTYVNIVGTFLVISSCDNDDVMHVNTFVRLGAGAKDPSEIKPIVLEPSVEVAA